MIRVSENILLQDSEVQYQFVRASGPGGQNVNKVASAAQLRFDVAHSPSLTPAIKQRLQKLAGRRLSSEGILIIAARRYRSQEMNRSDALQRLLDLIRKAEVEPKVRKKKTISQAAKRKRLAEKRRRSEKKRARQDSSSFSDTE